MEDSRFISQLLPVITIFLVAVIFVSVRLIARLKTRTVGKTSDTQFEGLKLKPALNKQTQNDRVAVDCPAFIRKSQGITKVRIKEINPVGGFIACPRPLPIGEIFELQLLLDNHAALIVQAEVLWNNAGVPADKIVSRGMKARFLKLDENIRLDLKQAMTKLRGPNAGA